MINRGKLSLNRGFKKDHGRRRHSGFDDLKKVTEQEPFGLERSGIDKERVTLMAELFQLLHAIKLKRAKFRHMPRGTFPANNTTPTTISLKAQIAWAKAELSWTPDV